MLMKNLLSIWNLQESRIDPRAGWILKASRQDPVFRFEGSIYIYARLEMSKHCEDF
jgi:hypothetical protein